MKTKIFFLATLITFNFSLFTFNCLAQAPNWLWAKDGGGAQFDEAASVAVDTLGNTYLVGYFSSPTAVFGTITLTNIDNTGATNDIFVAKYDASGNVVWANRAGGTGSDEATSVAVDTSGNVYVAGSFKSISFAFGATTLTNADNTGATNDIFFTKYDKNGNVIWAKSLGGTIDDFAYSVSFGKTGNTYITGDFTSTTIVFGTTTLSNVAPGSGDVFIAKYDTGGNVVWAKNAGGSGDDQAYSVATDGSGNSYVAGFFNSSTIVFGTTTLTNAGQYDIFLTKYDASGNVLWAKGAGSSMSDQATSVAVDASGNAYIGGVFAGTSITFGSTTLTNPGISVNDIFFAKYDALGNSVWAKSIDITDNSTVAVATDASGNAYVGGGFQDATVVLGSTTLTNADNTGNTDDAFIAKYNSAGTVLWAKSAAGTSDDYTTSIAPDKYGDIYLAGYFWSSPLSFGSVNITNKGRDDGFIAKLAPFDVTATSTNISCNGGSNGTATANAAGGVSPYNYLWSTTPAQFLPTATGLSAGTYTVTVTESNGATSWESVTLTQPTALTATMTIVNDTDCSASNGTAKVNVSGGTSSYSYSWSTAPVQTTQTATGLPIGTYYVTVTDAHLCTLKDTAVVHCPSSITNYSLQNNISVYPNPFNDTFTVKFDAEKPETVTLQMTDIIGKIVSSQTWNITKGENTLNLNTGSYCTGMYMLKLTSPEGFAIKTIVKQ